MTRILCPLIGVLTLLLGCSADRGAEGTVFGTVTDSRGAPVAECSVIPKAVSDVSQPLSEQAATTSAAGDYEWRLPSGTFAVQVFCDRDPSSPVVREVTVAPGERVQLDFTV